MTNPQLVSQAFVDRVGIAAGQVEIAGLNAKVTESYWKVPTGLVGGCTSIDGGRAKITYESDLKRTPVKVVTVGNRYVIDVPSPEPVQVGLENFREVKVKKTCGLLFNTTRADDIQNMNKELQKQACNAAANDAQYRPERQRDVIDSVTQLVKAVGVDPGVVDVRFVEAGRVPLAECDVKRWSK